jgi:hypothetical protein
MENYYKTEIVLNLKSKTQFEKLWSLDSKLIGTDDYMGFAYFWDNNIKWWLRDATPFQRIKVHKLFMENNIKFDKNEKCFISNKLAEKICFDICEKKPTKKDIKND